MKAIAIAVAVIVLAVIAYVGSPYWAVHQIRAAAEAGEGDRLAQYVDFPAVRESVKSQLMAFMSKSMEGEKLKKNPFAGLAQVMAPAIVGPMVDALITPETLVMMINRGKAPPTTLSRETSHATNPTPTISKETPQTTSPPPVPPPVSTSSTKVPRISQEYEGLDVFKVAVHDPQKDESLISMVLIRTGLFGWKLTSVRLPQLTAQ